MIDNKHKIEYEKNKPNNRKKRLQDSLPTPYPFAIAVELSNDCNSNCFMCPRKDLTRAVGGMSFSLFKKIIDELHENKVLLRKMFLYWMGEPLLNVNFDKMINYTREKNVAEMIVMATNAIALDEEKAKKLIDSQLDELYISLDAAWPKTYAYIRGNAATLPLVEKNILGLVEMKKKMGISLPYIRLKILRTGFNEDEIDDFKKKWENIVDEVYVEEDLNTWNGLSDTVNKNIEEDSQYKKNLKGLSQRWPCDRLWYLMAISQDGLITPCTVDWNGLGFIGDVNKNTIFDIWNSESLVEMRRKHLDGEWDNLPMCKNCQRWAFRNMGDWLIQNRDLALSINKRKKYD